MKTDNLVAYLMCLLLFIYDADKGENEQQMRLRARKFHGRAHN